MKERKRNVFGVRRILSAVFAVGFVVALLSTINAFAAANLFKIQNAELGDLSAGVTGAISTFDETNIESNVTFHKLDDTAKYTITLENTDSKDHVIQSITDDNDNPYVSYEYSSYANTVVKAGESFDFVVTAKYANAVTDKNARAQATNVKFFLRFTDIEEPEVIPITPNTDDNIMLSVTILAISATGLIVCAVIAIKCNKKSAKYLAVVIAAVVAVTATAGVKAATVETNSISITSNYGLYDKSVVTWTDANGDEHEEFVPYNEPANIQDPDKPGYTFTGWEDEDGNPVDPSEPITEDIEIHPTYRAHKYTIKFDGNGATGSMDNIEMTYDETKTLPANVFSFTGRTYMGWDTEANGSGVHHDDQAEVKNLTTEDNGIVTLYAQWAVNPFFINYDGNGATSGEMATTNCDYDQSCILRDNAFVKAGYHFTGWKYNNNDYVNKADVTNIIESGTITMVAQWEANHYTIVFDINTNDSHAAGDMADMANLEYDHDYTLTANAFTRTGYNFGGWNTEIDGRNFGLTDAQEFHNLTTTDNAIITLYAQWNPIHYNVVFHQNSDGVTGNMSSQVFTYDEAKNLTQNAFIKNHYKFMGWTTVSNGTGTKYDDRASIFNLTTVDGATIDLYAQWKERTAYLKGTVNNSWGSAGDLIRSLQGYSAATSFSHYEGEPNFDEIGTKYNMAISSSNFPVYTWIDGETIYWWSEAETIYAHEDSRNFFSGLKKAETIDYSGFDFSLTKNLTGFFRNTAALSTIDLSPLAAANPTTLEEMFNGSGIASVDLSPLNTAQTTNMKGMFNSATVLETVNLSVINTANVTDMSYLFSNSTNLKSVDFSHNNLSSVEDMNHMFYGDKKLESLNFTGVNTPNLQKMSWMFGGAKIASLDLSDFDTGNVTHFDELFYYADVANLDISGFDTHNATTFGSMFTALNAHGQVLDLSHFDTTSLNSSMYEMFLGTNASVIDLSSFDISAERAANIGMANILHISNSVETIYATEKLHLHDYSSVPDTNLGVPADYGAQSKLVGGAGTPLRQLTLLGLSEYDKARIDDPCNGKPGMFAVKNAQYICYNANIPSGETGAGARAGEYLTVGTGNLMNNPFVRDGYDFVGWATSAGGEKVYDDGAKIAIAEESKTPLNLYAVWKVGTRTITYDKNTDDTVRGTMANQSITYDTPTALRTNTFNRGYYAGNTFYSGQRYEFRGWNRAADGTGSHYDNEAVVEREFTEDTTLYAEWYDLCRTFETDSWSTIVNNIASDPMYYTPYGGCTKTVAIDMDGNGEDENYTVRLANTTTPEECAQSGYSQTGCGTVIEFVEDVDWRAINSQNTNSGSWASTQLVSWLNSDFYNKLPADLQAVIIPTYPIVTGTGSDGTSSDITKYNVDKNKIYLYSPKEIGLDNANDNRRDVATDTRILDYYTKHDNVVARSRNSEVINKNSNQWFTRTPVASASNFYHAIVSGTTYSSNANVGRGIAPVFRIGTPPSCRDFATDSWSTIVSNLENDPDYYSSLLGCQKEVEMDMNNDGENESYTVMLTNTSSPDECATAGFSQTACGTVIEFVDKVTERRWARSDTNLTAGGWKASGLATWLNSDFYNKLPDDLKQVIIPTYIVSGSGQDQESPDITLEDNDLNKIYLFSANEYGFTPTGQLADNKAEYMRVLDLYSTPGSREYLKRGSQLNNTWKYYWLRSATVGRTNIPQWINTVSAGYGAGGGAGAENAEGVFPVFRIGNNN